MFEIHPNLADQWVLFDTSAGLFDAVASFYSREDAEFALAAFEKRRQAEMFTRPQRDRLFSVTEGAF